MRYIISERNLLGFIARWAVTQSPYVCPDGLAEVLAEARDRFRSSHDCQKLGAMYYVDVKPEPGVPAVLNLVKDVLLPIAQVQKWNERKNGNTAPFGFVSRYDGETDPDDDFIDLDALFMNIARDLVKDEEETHRISTTTAVVRS